MVVGFHANAPDTSDDDPPTLHLQRLRFTDPETPAKTKIDMIPFAVLNVSRFHYDELATL